MAKAKRTLVLGSASQSRLRLLQAAGVDPEVVVSAVNEDHIAEQFAYGNPGSAIADLAHALAKAKAQDVARHCTDTEHKSAIVLGCDSILEWQGVALGKPGTAEAATSRLRQMRGTEGILHTGHEVIDLATGFHSGATASTVVEFARMSDREIDAYVATGEPLHVAGSFTLDGLSAPFVERVSGDPSNVIGLSLPMLRRLLGALEIDWLSVTNYG